MPDRTDTRFYRAACVRIRIDGRHTQSDLKPPRLVADTNHIMRTVPRNVGERIEFYKVHLETWQENHAQIGISEEDVAMMTELVEQARTAEVEQRMAQQAARTATQNLQIIQRKMNACGQLIISKIRGTANLEGTDIYPLASLPSPKSKSALGPPTKPHEFEMKLDPVAGSLELKWKCENPKGGSGTIYVVSRRIAQSAFEQLGIVGKKKFVDNTLPTGISQVTYRVQPVRLGHAGAASEYQVNFAFTGPNVQFIPRGSPANLAA